MTLAECYGLIKEAHDYLARCGMDALVRAQAADQVATWGSAVKRVKVLLPDDGTRPPLIAAKGKDHNLIEVVNQCVTMERLLDALAWAQTSGSELHTYQVARCHPTTSSAKTRTEEHDNDLVLVRDGEVARFEVSDVASEQDGNAKEERDLISLGVLTNGKGTERFASPWPPGRLFLVVSSDFARGLTKRTRAWRSGAAPFCTFTTRHETQGTSIIEVAPGRS